MHTTSKNSLNARDFMQKLEIALPFSTVAIQTDNGSEFHKYFADYLNERKIKHYWNYPGRPYRNGHVEKFNRTIQEEFIDQNEMWLDNISDFNRRMTNWLLWYNTERPHWSLDLLSPVDYLIKNGHLSKMIWTDTYVKILLNLVIGSIPCYILHGLSAYRSFWKILYSVFSGGLVKKEKTLMIVNKIK
jgi:hypothetical protein